MSAPPAARREPCNSGDALPTALRVRGYVRRERFVVERCRGKRVLDLGVVGATCEDPPARVEGFASGLHLQIHAVAADLLGVDSAAREIEVIQRTFPDLRLLTADVEALGGALGAEEPFDVVVAGDLIEHLSNPGKALEEIRPFLAANGVLLITCPNALGGPNYLRFLAGSFRDGGDHVQSYNQFTIANLLVRHGFTPREVWTGLDRMPRTPVRQAVYRVGEGILRAVPKLGGTLIVTATGREGTADR